jgi:hypothetical protein
VRKIWLEVVVPEVFRGTQRNQTPEIRSRADTAEIVFSAKLGVVSLVNQSSQSLGLFPSRVLMVQGRQVPACESSAEGVHHSTNQSSVGQPVLEGIPDHLSPPRTAY